MPREVLQRLFPTTLPYYRADEPATRRCRPEVDMRMADWARTTADASRRWLAALALATFGGFLIWAGAILLYDAQGGQGPLAAIGGWPIVRFAYLFFVLVLGPLIYAVATWRLNVRGALVALVGVGFSAHSCFSTRLGSPSTPMLATATTTRAGVGSSSGSSSSASTGSSSSRRLRSSHAGSGGASGPLLRPRIRSPSPDGRRETSPGLDS